MDEISSSDDVILSVGIDDNNPLYTQIDSLLNESVNEVLMKAPVFRINEDHVASTTDAMSTHVANATRKAAYILVPADFLRLVSITDKEFQRPIVELSVEGDDIAKRQHNQFLVAKNAKPVAVFSNSPSSQRAVTCYSYSNSATPAPTMLYIKRYNKNKMTEDSGLNEYMANIVSWVCAGKVFSAQGDVTKGKTCDENALALML